MEIIRNDLEVRRVLGQFKQDGLIMDGATRSLINRLASEGEASFP